jgi:hypothetical protein
MPPLATLASAHAGVGEVPLCGWSRNLRLANETVELIVTLEVGPRILVYRKHGGFNPFNVYQDQAGSSSEPVWRNRGGHRLWMAPEDKVTTYHPDNIPLQWEQLGTHHVRLSPRPETATGIQKEIEILLDPVGTGVTVVHRVTRIAATPFTLAPWAISVMAAGGVAVVPQPALGQHPRDLLPNRTLVLWPYTDLSDRRWSLGREYFTLTQDSDSKPAKIGLSLAPGWCGYWVAGVFFLKRFAWDPTAKYPDNGCNFEMFTNGRMLELESLAPLVELREGQSTEHREQWELLDVPVLTKEVMKAPADERCHPLLTADNFQLATQRLKQI